MAHAFRNDVTFRHESVSGGIAILKEPLKHRCFFRFAHLAGVHLSTELINASTNELSHDLIGITHLPPSIVGNPANKVPGPSGDSTSQNSTLREIVYRRGKRVFDIHGKFAHRAEAITVGEVNNRIDHRVTKNSQAIQRTLAGRVPESVDKLKDNLMHFGLKMRNIGWGVMRCVAFSAHRMSSMIERCHCVIVVVGVEALVIRTFVKLVHGVDAAHGGQVAKDYLVWGDSHYRAVGVEKLLDDLALAEA